MSESQKARVRGRQQLVVRQLGDRVVLSYEQHLGLPVRRRPDGSVVVEFPVVNEDAFRSTVLSFLEHAEVLEPADLRADMVQWLEAIAAGAAS